METFVSYRQETSIEQDSRRIIVRMTWTPFRVRRNADGSHTARLARDLDLFKFTKEVDALSYMHSKTPQGYIVSMLIRDGWREWAKRNADLQIESFKKAGVL